MENGANSSLRLGRRRILLHSGNPDRKTRNLLKNFILILCPLNVRQDGRRLEKHSLVVPCELHSREMQIQMEFNPEIVSPKGRVDFRGGQTTEKSREVGIKNKISI